MKAAILSLLFWLTIMSVNSQGYLYLPEGIGSVKTSSDGRFEIFREELPNFRIRDNVGQFQIGIARDVGSFASFSQPGDAIFRKLGGSHSLIFVMPGTSGDGNSYFKFGDEKNGGWFSLYNNKTVILNGKMGIGVQSPAYKLDVAGTIRAEEVKIENANWPDYVFSKDYQLPSLSEVSKHIEENKHLPGIPSAKEVEENGVGLGEMNVKLLQKIEELTLYMIQQQQAIEELQKEVTYLRSKDKKN